MKKISNRYLMLVLVLCLLQTQSAFATMSWMITPIRQLTNGVQEVDARFNRDGTLIAYRRLYGVSPTPATSDVWVVSPDGFNGTPVLTESVGEYNPSFYPDGRITYVRYTGGSDDIWVLDKDGYDRHLLVDGPLEQANPYWRPDGQRLAYYNEYQNDRSQIYLALIQA